jgi:3-hydroxyacyl-CoA dehydrogenase
MKSTVNTRQSEFILYIEIDNPPVNVSSKQVRAELLEAFRIAASATELKAIVLYGAGRDFMAGGDIREFVAATMPAPDPHLVFASIEAMHCPVIAALHGAVLGGGLELAMACHYRVAATSASLGLPEVKLGVIPGAGGTQRLTRIVGAQVALDLMLTGAPVDAWRALELGMVDTVVDEDVVTAASAYAHTIVGIGAPHPLIRDVGLDPRQTPQGLFTSCRGRIPEKDKGGQAEHAILDCVEAAFSLSFSEACDFERAAFNACRDSAASRAMRHLFFAEREASRIRVAQHDLRRVDRAGVIGAGTMGGGIAMCFANAGIPVTIVELKRDALDRGLNSIRTNYEGAVAKNRITTAQMKQRMSLISGTLKYEDIRDCDLVVEAAFESLEVKEAICRKLGGICKSGAIIATNTSSLDVNRLGSASGRPADFVGMHFFSPAHVMRLLEVVRGDHTSPEVLATVMALSKRLDKTAVVSGVCFGFIGNRMLEGYLREAEFMLMEGASPSQIDKAIESTGMAMGPCRMIDMAGVDVAANVVLENIKAGGVPNDPAYRAVVRELYAQGRFGQKNAKGYYRYEGRAAFDDPETTALCAVLALKHGITRRTTIRDTEIIERCLLPLINEGARILEEGISDRSGDIDVVWTSGYGYPSYKGGPMYAASQQGFDHVIARLRHYSKLKKDRYGYWDASRWLASSSEQYYTEQEST